ncbi:Small nuclear ribonucleoprotein Sm D2 like protein [Aduncisulcus paluster]|uniref:Small nuclear ribonucleoprotein Sm D2 n=1 Tax=Aduncisulcus paluster TaxID=2918883 RepID=A0ABQ5K3G3_9EUKA|nr:Small nuclear ribonucleoprotein Sm D2 like protein [Aduncisulcus paluster]
MSTIKKQPLSQEELLTVGPLRLLTESVTHNTKIAISLRNNHKMFANIRFFDKHFNMVLENVKETWVIRDGKQVHQRARFISKMFLRGDNVILVVKAAE